MSQPRPHVSCLAPAVTYRQTEIYTQWRKVKQMKPMCQCILSGRQFEETRNRETYRPCHRVSSKRCFDTVYQSQLFCSTVQALYLTALVACL